MKRERERQREREKKTNIAEIKRIGFRSKKLYLVSNLITIIKNVQNNCENIKRF